MSENRKELLMDFFDTILDQSELEPVKKLKSVFNVVRAGTNVISGEETNQYSIFKKEIKREVKKLVESEDYLEDDAKAVTAVFKDFFKDEQRIIDYYNNQSVFEEYIKTKSGVHSDFVMKFVKIIMAGIENHVKPGEWLHAIYDKSVCIENTVNDMHQMVGQIKGMVVAQQTAEQTGNEEKKQLQLHNDWYSDLYHKTLFLEESINDDIELILEDVFVLPKLLDSDKNVCDTKEQLIRWMKRPDVTSRQKCDGNASILLLYGKAGVGKSSLAAHLISKKFFETNCDADCYAIPLSRYIENLSDKAPWDFIAKYMNGINPNRRSVIILDGLDEVCVLKNDFDGYRFIQNLRDSVNSNSLGIKIIITSRIGYFENVLPDKNMIIRTLLWNKSTIDEWCKAYIKEEYHFNSRGEWYKNFIRQYDRMNWDDKKRDIFCVPLILYMSCAAKLDLDENGSLSEIYEKTFDYVGKQAYLKGDNRLLSDEEERNLQIDRQYAKELAYQAFLNDRLTTTMSLDDTLVTKARDRTASYFNCTNESLSANFQRYLGCYHFMSEDGKNGVEIAHKTVGEYFTAVKLYEDYFKKLSKDSDCDFVWDKIFEAFRYKRIPDEIFNDYLKIIINRDTECFDSENLRLKYIEGMKKQQLYIEAAKTAVPEYISETGALFPSQQISCAFRNLTWFLTRLEYDDYSEISACSEIGVYLFDEYNDVKCTNWEFTGRKLSRINLSCADFEWADLEYAKLDDSILCYVNLSGARLSGAFLGGSNLCETCLKGAILKGAFLSNANLRETNLNGADLSRANFDGTIFYETNFENADLSEANISNTVIRFACLNGANFEGAKLTLVKFERCSFAWAKFKGTDFTRVDLRDSDLSNADFNGAFYDSETRFPKNFSPRSNGMIKQDD